MTIQQEMAPRVLDAAKDLTATTLDVHVQPDGSTVMASTIKAFNALTGADLSEADGWLLVSLLNTSMSMTKSTGDFAYSSRALMAMAMMAQAQSSPGAQ